MNRREFLKDTIVLGFPLIVSASLTGCLEKYIIEILNEQEIEEFKFAKALNDFIFIGETKVEFEYRSRMGKFIQRGLGIVYKNHYLTMNHIVDFSEGVPINTMFGTELIQPEKLTSDTYIEGKKLEKIISNKEEDVAIFKAPNKYTNFPLEPRKEYTLGEKVMIIGNPKLVGNINRIATIVDIDGFKIEEHDYSNLIGIDKKIIPGDSGSPIVSLKDKKLLGLVTLDIGGIGYFQRIENFIKYIK